MKINELIESIKSDLGNSIQAIDLIREIRRAYIEVDPKNIVKVGEYLYGQKGCRLITASAMQFKDDYEIYYHFSDDKSGMILNVHVVLPQNKPEIESLANTFKAASWIEREMHELYGIDFLNHPEMAPLLSEGNWPEGEFPLSKNGA